MLYSTAEITNKIILFIIILVITFANFWIYRLFQTNVPLTILLVLESLLLFLSSSLQLKQIQYLSIIIIVLLSIFLAKNYFDKALFTPTKMESIQKLKNHEYYAYELGKIYKNRAGLFYFGELKPSLNRLNYKLFSFLDLRTYFAFDNPAIYYPIFFFPLFIFGLIDLLINPRLNLILYFFWSLFVSSLIYLGNNLDPVLLFPFFSICIGLGFIRIINYLKLIPFL